MQAFRVFNDHSYKNQKSNLKTEWSLHNDAMCSAQWASWNVVACRQDAKSWASVVQWYPLTTRVGESISKNKFNRIWRIKSFIVISYAFQLLQSSDSFSCVRCCGDSTSSRELPQIESMLMLPNTHSVRQFRDFGLFDFGRRKRTVALFSDVFS